jgi:hypothetical protein
MKYLVSLIVGILIGAALFGLGLYYNPFTSQTSVSPLAVTNEKVLDLLFSAVPQEGILYTDDGESINELHPGRVAKLLEPAVSDTRIQVVDLQDGGGDVAGIGIKFSSESEQTRLIDAQALANSVWHVYLPGQGTFMVDQTENYWSYIREVVIPARLSSGRNWVGTYHGIMTNGPNSLGTARVMGGSGSFTGLKSEAVESLSARGYSALTGPVSMTGNLTITLPKVLAPEPGLTSEEAEEE